MILQAYKAQVDLLLQVLPHIAKEEIFVLKGGYGNQPVCKGYAPFIG